MRSSRALTKHFGNQLPETIIEPGRGMVGNAGMIEAEVILVSKKSDAEDEIRWVYLDIGKFGGLAETMDESIRLRDPDRSMTRTAWPPACSRDRPVIQPMSSTRRCPTRSPVSLSIGDKVLIEGAGAYTTTYAAVAFNGFPPLQQYVI